MARFRPIGKQIKALRATRRLTQEQLGDTAGYTKAGISQIENGKREPSLEDLVKISDGLNADLRLDLVPRDLADIDVRLPAAAAALAHNLRDVPEDRLALVKIFLRTVRAVNERDLRILAANIEALAEDYLAGSVAEHDPDAG